MLAFIEITLTWHKKYTKIQKPTKRHYYNNYYWISWYFNTW